MEFFFGMESTIELSLQAEEQVIKGKEAVYGYFLDEVKRMEESGQGRHTEIVMLSGSQSGIGLIISAEERKTLITVEVSERNRLQAVNIGVPSC